MAVMFENYTLNETGFEGSSSIVNWEAQTFKALSDHNITSIALKLKKLFGLVSFGVSIRAVNPVTGKPTGADLATATVDEADLSSTAFTWVPIQLSNPVDLVKDTQYAICVKGPLGDAGAWLWSADKDPNSGVYTDGIEWHSINSGATWSIETASDALFKVYGHSVAPPESGGSCMVKAEAENSTGFTLYVDDIILVKNVP